VRVPASISLQAAFRRLHAGDVVSTESHVGRIANQTRAPEVRLEQRIVEPDEFLTSTKTRTVERNEIGGGGEWCAERLATADVPSTAAGAAGTLATWNTTALLS
jgi:hypothetical protein